MFQETAPKHWGFNYQVEEVKGGGGAERSLKSQFKRIECHFGKHIISRKMEVGWFLFAHRHKPKYCQQLAQLSWFPSSCSAALLSISWKVWEGGRFHTGFGKTGQQEIWANLWLRCAELTGNPMRYCRHPLGWVKALLQRSPRISSGVHLSGEQLAS